MLRSLLRHVPGTPALLLAGVAAGLAHPAAESSYRQPLSVLLDRGSGLALAAVLLLGLYLVRVAADVAQAGHPVRAGVLGLGAPALLTIAATPPNAALHIAAFWGLVLICSGVGAITAFELRSRSLLWLVAAPLMGLVAIPFVGLGAWQLGALVALGVGVWRSHRLLSGGARLRGLRR